MSSQRSAAPSATRARPRSAAAPQSRSAISASPSNSITAATSSRSGLVAASRRRDTAATETTPLVAVNYGIKSTLDGTLTPEQRWDRKRYQGLMVSGVDYRLV